MLIWLQSGCYLQNFIAKLSKINLCLQENDRFRWDYAHFSEMIWGGEGGATTPLAPLLLMPVVLKVQYAAIEVVMLLLVPVANNNFPKGKF